MTREEWEREYWPCFGRLRAKGYDPLAAQAKALEITRARYGPMPPKPPLWLRLGVKFIGDKLLKKITQGGVMRWDKYLEAAAVAGLMTVVLGSAPFFLDGKVTGAEGIMLLGIFIGGAGLYMKQHPMTLEEVEVEVAKIDAREMVEGAKVIASDKVDAAKVVAAEKVADAKETK